MGFRVRPLHNPAIIDTKLYYQHSMASRRSLPALMWKLTMLKAASCGRHLKKDSLRQWPPLRSQTSQSLLLELGLWIKLCCGKG
jgi:hypothetical protein